MEIQVFYCQMWNYLPQAASLAAELKKTLGVEAKLTPGSKGIFDVYKNGDLIFSKFSTGRFPDKGEITKLLKDNWS